MPRVIIKIKDKYFDWSTIVDAPVTYGMTLDEFTSYYRHEYGEHGSKDLPERLGRVEATGTSSRIDKDLKSFLVANRAGENERCISAAAIYRLYAHETTSTPEPSPARWRPHNEMNLNKKLNQVFLGGRE